MDEEALLLFEGSGDATPESKPLDTYDAWTESEVALTRERIRHRISRSDTQVLSGKASSKHIHFKSHSMLELFGSLPELKRTYGTSDFATRYFVPDHPKSILVQDESIRTHSRDDNAFEAEKSTNLPDLKADRVPYCFRSSESKTDHSGTSTPFTRADDDASSCQPVFENRSKPCWATYDDDYDAEVCSTCLSLPPYSYHQCVCDCEHVQKTETDKTIFSDSRTEFERQVGKGYKETPKYFNKSIQDDVFKTHDDDDDSQAYGQKKRKSSILTPRKESLLEQVVLRDYCPAKLLSQAEKDENYEKIINILEQQIDQDQLHGLQRQSLEVAKSRADIAHTSRNINKLLTKVSEDTIEETILVRDRNAEVRSLKLGVLGYQGFLGYQIF